MLEALCFGDRRWCDRLTNWLAVLHVMFGDNVLKHRWTYRLQFNIIQSCTWNCHSAGQRLDDMNHDAPRKLPGIIFSKMYIYTWTWPRGFSVVAIRNHVRYAAITYSWFYKRKMWKRKIAVQNGWMPNLDKPNKRCVILTKYRPTNSNKCDLVLNTSLLEKQRLQDFYSKAQCTTSLTIFSALSAFICNSWVGLYFYQVKVQTFMASFNLFWLTFTASWIVPLLRVSLRCQTLFTLQRCKIIKFCFTFINKLLWCSRWTVA